MTTLIRGLASPSLVVALHSIFVEKKVQPTLGEFSRILLVHGLYRRSWEVTDHLEQPLSHWLPTSEHQHLENAIPTKIWLSTVPTYIKWRSMTCDCLDILHWAANSVIGATSGVEPPTVAHLHLSRIILLIPFKTIERFAMVLSGTTCAPIEQMVNFRTTIKRWVLEDQYKARLAMIHAGAQLWHIRRFSSQAFYEPHAVLISILSLWAFGAFTDKTSLDLDARNMSDPQRSTSLPLFIHLDRPADDELVQTFIDRGNEMYAVIGGGSVLCSEGGPEKVLEEGVNLLRTLIHWGSAKKAIRLLERLANVASNRITA